MIGYFKYLKYATIDLIKDFKRVLLLAGFEYKQTNKDMFLGSLWNILYPFIQIGAYWLVFGIGIRQNREIDGVQYVVWLTVGYTAWIMVSKGITAGANSIYQKGNLITKSNIPTFIIPLSSVLAKIMEGLWTVGLMFIIFFIYGYSPSVHMFNLVYYTVYLFFFVSVTSLITSTLVMIARDFKQLITMIMRLLFFFSPVTWQPGDNMPDFFMAFHKHNPFAYIINGYRDSMLYGKDFYSNPGRMLGFLITIVVLYLIGIGLQKKLRNNVLDYL